MRPFAEIAEEYARAVVAGEILACKWTRLACKRHIEDRKRERRREFRWRFDAAKAERVCRFIELLPHTKGKWAVTQPGRPGSNLIHLEPWQVFFLCAVFGWVNRETGRRRFRRVYLCVPRKNGKSIIAGGIGLYMFAADGEYGAEVYSGATSEKQAWEVFRPARLMAERTPEMCEAFGVGVHAKNLHIHHNGSRFEPVIGKPGDGASPSCAIVDEYHEHQTDELYDTMLTGMGARDQPMMLVITTAGSDIAGPCSALQSDVQKVLEGKIEDDELFGIIYTVDERDDWTSEEALRKANPNYGISVGADYLQSRQQEATRSSRKQNVFKTKHLNIWVHARDPWMNMEEWERRAASSLSPDQFRGARCWMAMDLSSKLDIAATIRLFWRDEGEDSCRRCNGDGEVEAEGGSIACVRCAGTGTIPRRNYTMFGRYYLPEERAMEPEKQHYQEWVHQGHLIPTAGNVIDYERIKDDILEDAREVEVAGLCFDPWNAMATALELQAEGLNVVEVPQTVRHLSEPMKEIESLVLAGRFHHAGDPVFNWMMSNVTAKEDAKGNLFPRKENKESKIDGPAALITAMSQAMLDRGGDPEESIYESRKVLVF